jgi:probable rRNA maturation factor
LRAELNCHASAALACLPGEPTGEVRVRIIDDAEMSAAHLKYSNIPGTTDVLTFDLTDGASADGEPLDVDILVCIDEASRQAGARHHTVERELLLYILHGVLHCLGHDDHDDTAYARMHALEDEILEAIGVGRTFESDSPRRQGEHGGNAEPDSESVDESTPHMHAHIISTRPSLKSLSQSSPVSSPCPPCLRGDSSRKDPA